MTAAAEGLDGWTPEFDGQRPPFRPGHELSMVAGHRSERRVGPLAAEIAQDLLTDPDVPQHIREPLFAAAVQAWSRAEAVCRLLWQWLADKDVMAGLASATTSKEDETQAGNTITRKGTTRTMPSVLETLRKYEAHAANLRRALGLDPASAARVGRDLALARHMSAGATPLDEALEKIEQNRALPAGAGDG